MQAPFFGAFHALAVDDGSARARFAFRLLAAGNIECMVDAIESAVATPQYKIVMYRALRRKVLGQGAPLTTRAQDVHDPIHHLPDTNRSFVGHLEKFFSPSRCESDSLTAMGHGRMERPSHGADGLFRC